MNGIVILEENIKSLRKLSKEDLGVLMMAILDSACGEEPDESEFSFPVELLYPIIQGSVDRMRGTSEMKSAAGRMGGRPKKQEEKQTENQCLIQTEKQEEKQTEKPEPNHTEPNHTEPNHVDHSPARRVLFEQAWEAYPKKQGRKEAEAAYERAIKAGTPHEKIMAGIEAYKRHIERNKTDPQYVKQGSTFFRQAAWNDDWGEEEKPKATDYKSMLQGNYSELLRKGTG